MVMNLQFFGGRGGSSGVTNKQNDFSELTKKAKNEKYVEKKSYTERRNITQDYEKSNYVNSLPEKDRGKFVKEYNDFANTKKGKEMSASERYTYLINKRERKKSLGNKIHNKLNLGW